MITRLTQVQLADKIIALRLALSEARGEGRKAARALDFATIQATGLRGELLATRRELAGLRRAAEDLFKGGPVNCSSCDAPAIAALRAALARKIW